MKNKYLLKVLNKEYVVFLHNGYSEFSYGVSVNPLVLSYEEYRLLMNYIAKSHLDSLVKNFEESQDYDFLIPSSISKTIGFSILTLSPPSCCVYTSEKEEVNIVAEKERLIEVINNSNMNGITSNVLEAII